MYKIKHKWEKTNIVYEPPCLKKPLEPDRNLLEHGFLPKIKRSSTRFLQMGPPLDFIRS